MNVHYILYPSLYPSTVPRTQFSLQVEPSYTYRKRDFCSMKIGNYSYDQMSEEFHPNFEILLLLSPKQLKKQCFKKINKQHT